MPSNVYLITGMSHDGVQPITVCRTREEADDILADITRRTDDAADWRNQHYFTVPRSEYPDTWAMDHYHLSFDIVELDLDNPRNLLDY